MDKLNEEYERLRAQFDKDELRIEFLLPTDSKFTSHLIPKLMNCVRVTHLPTKIQVEKLDANSQIQNIVNALKDLIIQLKKDE